MNNYQLTHTDDPSIVFTYRKPTTLEFATYWNAKVEAGDCPDITAQTNLLIACRTSPSETVFAELLDNEWSSLAPQVYHLLLGAAGLFTFGNPHSKDFDDGHGEKLDAKELRSSFGWTPSDSDRPRMKQYAKHAALIEALGINLLMIEQFIGKRNPELTRVFIALPKSIGGYYIGRVPSFGDRYSAQQIQYAASGSGQAGAFDALCRFFLDCSLLCMPLTPSQLIEQWPGAVAAIGIAVRDIGRASFAVEQKK